MSITAKGINYVDLGVMIITAVILLPMSIGGLRINRVEGTILLLGYITYIYFLLPT
jgi:cation:H+ antiporter